MLGSGVASPKIAWEAKIFDFRLATVFCLGYRLSKHKMTRYSINLGVWSLTLRGYAYAGKPTLFPHCLVEDIKYIESQLFDITRPCDKCRWPATFAERVLVTR